MVRYMIIHTVVLDLRSMKPHHNFIIGIIIYYVYIVVILTIVNPNKC
jgi:hypothetical protein